MTDEFVFQKLDKTGLETLVKWADDEGWNPGPNDADVYWQTDPEGYYGYFLNDELIAGGSLVSYNGEFGFMGFFIVKPEYRGKGIGRKLWYERRNKLLERLKSGATIGMDGVVDMQPFYNKGGFEIVYRDERYEFEAKPFNFNEKITPVTKEEYNDIIEYDKLHFGYSRPQFLIPWMDVKTTNTFKYKENEEIKGFVTVRKANKGYKICPLFAENEIIAEELFKKAMDSVKGNLIYLDIPVINEKAANLVKKYKGQYVFECARMYYGELPKTDISKIFGITTFELG